MVQAPQAGATDMSPPTVTWAKPVADAGKFDVEGGQAVTLNVSASDNVGVTRVEFIFWNHPRQRWETFGTVTSAPWQVTIKASQLNLAWNQVNAVAWDSSGNSALSSHIWLYDTDPLKVDCNGRKAGEWACVEIDYSALSRSWADSYYFAGSHNCTRYAAHRLALNGYADPGTSWGNAWEWSTRAPGPKDGTPAVGAIAQWDISEAHPSGHVAYVEATGLGMIVVTEDNWHGVTYRKQIATDSPDWPSRFIHVLT